MRKKIALIFHYKTGNNRYQLPLWQMGAREAGYTVTSPESAHVAVMWGQPPEYVALMKELNARGVPVLVLDYPYWNRRKRRSNESYKVSINGQHPVDFVMQEKHDHQRYQETAGPAILPWQKNGDFILLAGMGIKSETGYGYAPRQWETKAVNEIKRHTDRPIIYRPKPNDNRGAVIPGTVLDQSGKYINDVLQGAHAVVCHHGNPAIDALAMGIPAFVNGGVAQHFALKDLSRISRPWYPDDREQLFYNLAHWQYSVKEIKAGIPLISFKHRGLI